MGHKINLAHACNNGDCSNPRHLYWSTPRENIVEDGRKFGTHSSPYENMIKKYGETETRRRMSKVAKGNKGGAGNKGKPKSKQHCENISKAIKKKHQDKLDAEAKAREASVSQPDSNS